MKKWCISFGGLEICGDDSVYRPSEDTLILFSWIDYIAKESCIVYDVGSGSGVITLGFASKGVYSVGIDVSYSSALSGLNNSFTNNLDGYVDYVNGDALDSLRLDLMNLIIVSNPPYLPGEFKDEEDRMYIGGIEGVELITRLLEYFIHSKAKNLFIVMSSYTKIGKVLDRFNDKLCFRLIDQIRLNSEILYLYEIMRRSLKRQL